MSNAASIVGMRKHAKKSKKITRPTEDQALGYLKPKPAPSVVVVFPVESRDVSFKTRFDRNIERIITHWRDTKRYNQNNAHKGYKAAEVEAARLEEALGIVATVAMVTEALARIEGKAA